MRQSNLELFDAHQASATFQVNVDWNHLKVCVALAGIGDAVCSFHRNKGEHSLEQDRALNS